MKHLFACVLNVCLSTITMHTWHTLSIGAFTHRLRALKQGYEFFFNLKSFKCFKKKVKIQISDIVVFQLQIFLLFNSAGDIRKTCF